MNHDPNHQRPTQRRLNVEMMETRLMLSISPTGPLDPRALVEVEIVPPPTQDAQPIDSLDFSHMAEQFNSLHASEQASSMPKLPELKESPLDHLSDPSNFLGSTSDQASGVTGTYEDLATRLSGEVVVINWDSLTAGELTYNATSVGLSFSASQVPTSEETRPVDGSSATFEMYPDSGLDGIEDRGDSVLIKSDTEDLNVDLSDIGITDGVYARRFSDGSWAPATIDFVVIRDSDRLDGLSYTLLVSEMPRTDFGAELFDNDGLMVGVNDHFDPSRIGLDFQLDLDMGEVVFIDGHDFGDYLSLVPPYNPLADHGFDLNFRGEVPGEMDGFSLSDFTREWGNEPQFFADIRSLVPGQSGNPLDVPPPPTSQAPNFRDSLRATSSLFYQELFGMNNTNGSNELDQSSSNPTSTYDSPQTNSFVRQFTNEEGEVYEESSLLTQFGGGDGSTSDVETEGLALFENEENYSREDLELEGLMDTELDEMFVEKGSNDGEGGVIDISVAMNMAQKPIAATPEGIVEAGMQQDGKVAFEGLYGQGQTFELANVEEEEAFSTAEEPATEEISASLLEALNQMPLDTNAKENLDETDINPTAHELALGQVTGEMDFASMLPTDAFSWATFAFLGQHATRHPDDRKKKK